MVRCEVQTDLGSALIAHLGPEDDPARLSVGSRVDMTWAYEGAYLVPEAINPEDAGITESN